MSYAWPQCMDVGVDGWMWLVSCSAFLVVGRPDNQKKSQKVNVPFLYTIYTIHILCICSDFSNAVIKHKYIMEAGFSLQINNKINTGTARFSKCITPSFFFCVNSVEKRFVKHISFPLNLLGWNRESPAWKKVLFGLDEVVCEVESKDLDRERVSLPLQNCMFAVLLTSINLM